MANDIQLVARHGRAAAECRFAALAARQAARTLAISMVRRDLIAVSSSVVLLSVSVFVWRDLFLFSKVVHLPTWTENLPSPINTPAYLAFLCVLPAAFASSTQAVAVRAVAWAVLSAPVPALVAYAIGATQSPDVLPNVLFNYGWVVGFQCLLPALALLAIRALARAVKERADGKPSVKGTSCGKPQAAPYVER